MIKKITNFLIAFQAISVIAMAQDIPDELIAPYGPPAEANVWTKYVLPLNAETFNTDETTFQAAMANITSFWIQTEMHSGADVGGIDEVKIGDAFSSNFDLTSESWSSGGDGTMEWIPTDGVNGGFLQISDWATGDWHWLIAPYEWNGDWSSLIGQNIEFWFKTDKPTVTAKIKLTTNTISRLVISLPISATVPLYDSVMVEVGVTPTPTEDITISLTSSNNSCINIPSTVVVRAGETTAGVYATTAIGASIGCESVVEATSSGYLTSRVTIKILGTAGINNPLSERQVSIYPNPGHGQFTIANHSGKSIERVVMYDLHGRTTFEFNGKDVSNTALHFGNQPAGIYFVKLYLQNQVVTSKLMIE
jgi:hypothetical protein